MPLARHLGVLDMPGKNDKIHSVATPRLGGIGIILVTLYAIFSLGSFDNRIYIFSGGLIVAITGILDDKFNLTPLIKLAGQSLSAFALVYAGVRFRLFNWWVLDYFVSILFIVSLCNALNMIDGMDSLAAGVSFICSVGFFIISWVNVDYISLALCFVLIISILGFLPFNLRPARTFLGDGGSQFLGYMLALFTLRITGSISFERWIGVIAILIVPVADITINVLRRATQGKRLFLSDRGHFYDKLYREYGYRKAILIIFLVGLLGLFVGLNVIFTCGVIRFVIFAFFLLSLLILVRRLKFLEYNPDTYA